MKSFCLSIFAATLIAAAVLTSCKKAAKHSSASRMLEGTWKSVRAADDENHNGIWDASEDTDLSDDTLRITFQADGSGAIEVEGPPLVPCVWQLQNADTVLRIIIPSISDTSLCRIMTLTSTDLVTANDTSKTIRFIAFKKQ